MLYETRFSGTIYTPNQSWSLTLVSFFSFLFCIKLDLHLNVNTVCGQRRVCVLSTTPRSQQTWTVPTTVGQTAGESPNTPVCRSTWASITRAVSAVYPTMKRPRTPAPMWVVPGGKYKELLSRFKCWQRLSDVGLVLDALLCQCRICLQIGFVIFPSQAKKITVYMRGDIFSAVK